MCPAVNEQAIEGLKFSECLPQELALEMLQERLRDDQSTTSLLKIPVRFVNIQLP